MMMSRHWRRLGVAVTLLVIPLAMVWAWFLVVAVLTAAEVRAY